MKLVNVVLVGVVGFITLLNQACALEHRKDPPPNTPPNDSKAVVLIGIGEDGTITSVRNAAGEELDTCNLCSAETDDPHCDRRRKIDEELIRKGEPAKYNLCGSLTRGTVNRITPITVIQNHKNPDCVVVESDGKTRVHPRGCKH